MFQFVFRSYYRLDNAGLGDKLKVAYFNILQAHRRDSSPDLRGICDELGRYDTEQGKQSIQFSFATKLLATIDANQPIYDSFVASLFNFRAYGPPKRGEEVEQVARILRLAQADN